MAHYLTLLKNGQVFDKIELAEKTMRIGRSPDTEFTIYDEECVVSRFHAVVRFFADRYWVKNDRGLCGTLLNGELVEDWTPLEQADAIVIGSYVVTYSYGYTWDPNGPTLYSGPEKKAAVEAAKPMEQTMMIQDHQRPEYMRLKFDDGREQLVYHTSFVCGNHRRHAVWINDPSVDAAHAEIFEQDGAWYIRDLGSRHGVCVGNHKVSESVLLSSGQAVRLGKVGFRVRIQRGRLALC